MKFIILLLLISCASTKKQNSFDVALTQDLAADIKLSNGKFLKVGSLIKLVNGIVIKTKIINPKPIKTLFSNDQIPYLLFSGRSCDECDASTTLYLHRIKDGDMLSDSKQSRYGMPGKINDYMYDSVSKKHVKFTYEERAFYGKCLDSNEPVVIWWGYNFNGKLKKSFYSYAIYLDGNKPKVKIFKKVPKLGTILSKTSSGYCIEIAGITQSAEP
jgi:hypothetical protein